LLFELEQRLSGNHLDDAAEYIGGMAVVPTRTRLFGKRQSCDAFDQFRIGQVGVEESGLRITLVHGILAIEAVGDPGRMA